MELEYDPDKAALNVINHGVDFEEAKTALLDPYALTKEDIDSHGEARFITLGMSSQGRLLIVVWTVREPRYRLISSWKANHRGNAMNNNSDAIFEEYADLDFDDAKSVQDVPALAALQASHAAQSNKTKITMRVDRQVLAAFKAKAAHTGDSYQAIMNDALKQYLTGQSLQEVIRETIRQELKHA